MQIFSSKYTAQQIEEILNKANTLFNTISIPTANYGTFKLKRYIKNYNGCIVENNSIYGKTVLPEAIAVINEGLE